MMKTFYCVAITDEYRPNFMDIKAVDKNDALFRFARSQYPDKVFDGINHVKIFLENEFREINVDDDSICLYDKYFEVWISEDLNLIMKNVSNQFQNPVNNEEKL